MNNWVADTYEIKTVETAVQPVSATTHSTTHPIQPIISADGILMSRFGELYSKVHQTVFVPPRKSGRLAKKHFRTCLVVVHFPTTERKSVLLLDSWSCHCDHTISTVQQEGKDIMLFSLQK